MTPRKIGKSDSRSCDVVREAAPGPQAAADRHGTTLECLRRRSAP